MTNALHFPHGTYPDEIKAVWQCIDAASAVQCLKDSKEDVPARFAMQKGTLPQRFLPLKT
jgi:hypothetical protein